MLSKDTHCRRCTDAFACLKKKIVPVIGKCSLLLPDRRSNAIRMIRERVLQEGGSACLRHKVTVTVDQTGFQEPIAVLRVSSIPGASQEPWSFAVGHGVDTDNLSTEDLERIAEQLIPDS